MIQHILFWDRNKLGNMLLQLVAPTNQSCVQMKQQVVQHITRINCLLKLTLQQNFLPQKVTEFQSDLILFNLLQWQMFAEWCHYKLRQPVTLRVLTLNIFFSSTGPEMFYNINFLLWIFEQLPVIPSVIPGTSFATMSCIVLSNLKNLKFLCNNQTWCCLRPSKCFQYKSLFKSLTAVSFTTLLDFWLNSEWGTSHLWYCF